MSLCGNSPISDDDIHSLEAQYGQLINNIFNKKKKIVSLRKENGDVCSDHHNLSIR